MQEYCLVIIVTCVVFVDYLLYALLLPFVGRLIIAAPPYGESGSYFQAGVLFSITAVSQTLSMPIWHYLSVKSAKYSAIFGLLICVGACSFFGYFIHNYWLNLAARFLQGLGSAGAAVGSFRMLNDKRQRMITGGIAAAALLGPPLGGFLFEIKPCIPFYFLAAFSLVLAVALIFINEDTPSAEESMALMGSSETVPKLGSGDFSSVLSEHQGSIWSMYTLKKKSNVTTRKVYSLSSLAVLVPIVLCNAVVVFVEWSLCAEHRDHLSALLAGIFLTAFSVGYLITALFVQTYFEDEFITIAGGLLGCAAALLISVKTEIWWVFIIILVLLGTCTALVEANFSQALRYVGYDKSAILELTELSVRLGCIFSGLLGGLFVELIGFKITYHVFAILLAIGAPLVFSITFWVEPPPEEVKPTAIQMQIQERRQRSDRDLLRDRDDEEEEISELEGDEAIDEEIDGGLFSI